MPAPLTQVSDRAWFVRGPASNWTVVHADGGVVLVDAGYPADADLVAGSVRATGADLGDVVAVLVTHAHTDHIGSLPALLERNPRIEVLAAEAEVAAVRGPEREQITVATAGTRLLRPRFARWALRAVRAGGTRSIALPTARAFEASDLERAGLAAVPAPGHTPGSTMYRLTDATVLVTGDAFVTDHPTYARPRAGAIDPVFSADPERAARSAAVPDTDVVLPGHGPLRPAAR